MKEDGAPERMEDSVPPPWLPVDVKMVAGFPTRAPAIQSLPVLSQKARNCAGAFPNLSGPRRGKLDSAPGRVLQKSKDSQGRGGEG